MTSERVRARPPSSRRAFLRARAREIAADTFWLVPSLFVVGGVILSFLLIWLDDVATASAWWIGTADAASEVLSVIATAILMFIGVVFSVTLVALQLASQQFSPRITRTFVRSTTTKVAFGVFIATFVTSLLSLSSVEERAPDVVAPVATVTVSLFLACASLVVFIIFVNSTIRLVRVAHLVSAVAEETRKALDLIRPVDVTYVEAQAPRFAPLAAEVRVGKTARRTRRRSQGVVVSIDVGKIAKLSADHDCVVRFRVLVGQHVGDGMLLAEVYGSDGPSVDQIRRAIQFGRSRTFYQDPSYGIRALVDIGCQALSPAVNAPTTAVQVIDRLTDVTARIGARPDPTGMFTDYQGVVRVVVPVTGWAELVGLVYTELRTYGVGAPQVTRRLVASIDELIRLLPPERQPVLHEQRALLVAAVEAYHPEGELRRLALHPDPLGLG